MAKWALVTGATSGIGESFTRFNAECKFYGDFGFHQLFEESKQLESWLEQLLTAGDPGDANILFMKMKYVVL